MFAIESEQHAIGKSTSLLHPLLCPTEPNFIDGKLSAFRHQQTFGSTQKSFFFYAL